MEVSLFPPNPQMSDKVRQMRDEFNRFVDSPVIQGERKRLVRNYDYYDGVEYGQWQDKDLLRQILADGKPAHTFNWIQGLVDSTIGHLMQAPVDTKFVRPGAGRMDQTDVLQSLYEMDSERDDYVSKKRMWKKDFLIHTGIVQFVWDKRDDRLGNVGVRLLNPKHVIRDPYWNTPNMEDSRRTFVYSWLAPEQIKETYRTKAAEVDWAIERYRTGTVNNSPDLADRSQPYYDQDGGLFKVIEAHWCDLEEKLCVVDIETGVRVQKFEGKDYAKFNKEALQAVASLENPAWRVYSDEKRVSKIFTFCPALATDLVLEDGDYPLQLGRQPFIFGSYKESYEKRMGLVDKLIDAADVFNKRQSMVSHALGGSTGAGVFFAETSVFGGDETRKAEFESKISQNGVLIELNDGAVSEQRIREVNRPQIPMDILKSTEDQRTYMQDLAGITPGMQGYSEKSDESGKLYKSKVRQAMIGLEMFSEYCKDKDKEFARCYQIAAKQVYAGPSRKFLDRAKNEEFWINRTMVAPDGTVVKMQYVEEMPEYLVVIEEKRTGKATREARRAELVETLRYLRNPVSIAILETLIMQDFDLDEETMSKFRNSADLWITGQAKQVEAGMAQSQMVIQQAAQAGQPQQQPVPTQQGA